MNCVCFVKEKSLRFLRKKTTALLLVPFLQFTVQFGYLAVEVKVETENK